MIIRKWILFYLAFVICHNVSARVSEISIKVLPTGQIVIPVQIPDVENTQYVLFDATGENVLRGDINKKMFEMNVDTTASKVIFENFKVGTYAFRESVSFKISKSLVQRTDLVFPENVIGTVGSSMFRSTAIQMNLSSKKLVVADSFEELNFTENLMIIVFSSSFVNNIPVVKVGVKNFGEQRLYIDPSKSVAFHFDWKQVSDEAKEMSEGKLQIRSNSLNGKDSLELIVPKSIEVVLESDAIVKGHKPSFSSTFKPCIGSDFLKNYAFTIDFRNATMYLDPINAVGKSEIVEMGL